jgi:hypothetical protein
VTRLGLRLDFIYLQLNRRKERKKENVQSNSSTAIVSLEKKKRNSMEKFIYKNKVDDRCSL